MGGRPCPELWQPSKERAPPHWAWGGEDGHRHQDMSGTAIPSRVSGDPGRAAEAAVLWSCRPPQVLSVALGSR